jgi:hypothetical protein
MRSFKNVVTCFLVVIVLCLASLPNSSAAQYTIVQGVVIDEEGVGLSDVKVQVYASSGAFIAETSTGSDGSFSMIIEFGAVNFYFTKSGYAKITKSINVQSIYTDLGTIILGRPLKLSTSTLSIIAIPGDKISIPFTVSNSGEGSEVVEFQLSKPQDWYVSVLDQSREVLKTYMSSGQSLTLQLEVTVPSTAPVNLGYNVSLTAIGTTNSSLSITVMVRAQPTTTFFGRTVDEYNNGIEGVDIKVYSSDGALIKSSATSSDGAFSIELPTPTTVSAHFSREGYVEVTKNVALQDENVNLGEIVLAKAVKLYSSVLGIVAIRGKQYRKGVRNNSILDIQP